MRVIQLISGAGLAGADRVAMNLGAGLRSLGHETIYAIGDWFVWRSHLYSAGFATWSIRQFRGLNRTVLRDFVRQTRPDDLIVAHDSSARHLVLAARFFGLRSRVWLVRHCMAARHAVGASLLHRFLVERQVAVSDAVRLSVIRSGFPGHRITRIYPGIELPLFAAKDGPADTLLRQRCLGPPADDRLTIGIVARYHPRNLRKAQKPDPKGYDLLFHALAGVRFPHRILMLGPSEPGADDQLRDLARAAGKAPADLVFGGFTWDIAPYYRLMDLNVLPSRGEGLGLALVEGMAAGVCSVGAANGGMLEIIEDGRTGILFPTGDALALRNQLERLAADPALRAQLGRAGRESVRARFSAPRMVQEFDQLACRPVARGAGGGGAQGSAVVVAS